jgi:hypothetical protein
MKKASPEPWLTEAVAKLQGHLKIYSQTKVNGPALKVLTGIALSVSLDRQNSTRLHLGGAGTRTPGLFQAPLWNHLTDLPHGAQMGVFWQVCIQAGPFLDHSTEEVELSNGAISESAVGLSFMGLPLGV